MNWKMENEVGCWSQSKKVWESVESKLGVEQKMPCAETVESQDACKHDHTMG